MSILVCLLATIAVVSSQTCKSAGVGPCDGKGGCRDPSLICTAVGTPDEACCSMKEVVPANLNPLASCMNLGLGQCNANKYCGAGSTCTAIGTADEACCANANVVLIPPPFPTIKPPVTTAKPVPCVDKTNPATGVSDCPNRVSYCNNPVYFDLMTEQCPRTCNRCTGGQTVTTKPSNCVDKVNPANGISDCPNRISYCNNAVYYDLMTEQCPRTCNRCTGGQTVTPRPSSTCVDRVNPSTGVSDCTRMASYCNNAAYFDLMTHECPRTCRRC